MSMKALIHAVSKQDTSDEFEPGTVVRWRDDKVLFAALKVDSEAWIQTANGRALLFDELLEILGGPGIRDVYRSWEWEPVRGSVEKHVTLFDAGVVEAGPTEYREIDATDARAGMTVLVTNAGASEGTTGVVSRVRIGDKHVTLFDADNEAIVWVPIDGGKVAVVRDRT